MLKEIYVPEKDGFERTLHSFGMADDIENACWGPKKAGWGPGIRNVYIIHFVVQGKGYLNGREIRENQGFILYPNRVYEYHADEKDPWHYFWIVLSPKASEMLEKYGLSDDTEIFRFYFHNNFIEAFKALIASPELTTTHDFITGLFHMMMSFVLVETSPLPANRGKAHVDHAMDLINNNYHLKIKISDIADRLFLDPGYLYNLFMKYAGVSPKEYLNTVRIQKACELLADTGYLISEISCSVGYDDPLQFSKFFKSRMGMSPMDYRCQHQEKGRTQGERA